MSGKPVVPTVMMWIGAVFAVLCVALAIVAPLMGGAWHHSVTFALNALVSVGVVLLMREVRRMP